MLVPGRKFEQHFKHWNIVLPERDLANRSPGFIAKAGWPSGISSGKTATVNTWSSMPCTV